MSVNISMEIANHYSSDINDKIGLFHTYMCDESNIDEYNYKKGRQIYDDINMVMVNYLAVVERDSQNISDVASELLQTDNEMLFDN